MNLLENNFAILNAEIYYTRRELKDCLEDTLLSDDVDEQRIRDAYTELSNPNKRIASELSWILEADISDKEIISKIKNNEFSGISSVREISSEPLTFTNIAISNLEHKKLDKFECVLWIVQICRMCDKIKKEHILQLINNIREKNGFNKISDISLIDNNLKELLNYYAKTIKNTLDQFSSLILVEIITEIVNKLTYQGSKPLPILAEKIIEDYTIAVQGFLNKEQTNIERSIKLLLTSVKYNYSYTDTAIKSNIDYSIEIINNWNQVMRPIQIAKQSQGRKQEYSEKLFELVFSQDLVKCFVDKEKLDLLKIYLDELEKVFVKIEGIDKTIKQHKKALEEAIRKNKVFEKIKELENKINDTIRYENFYKNSIISLIDEIAKLDNSREISIPVANIVRNEELLKLALGKLEIDFLKSINIALLRNFGHISDLRRILMEEKESLDNLNIVYNNNNSGCAIYIIMIGIIAAVISGI